MEHPRASRISPTDDITQLGEGSAPPPWATASSARCEESRTENLTLLAEAAGQLAPPLQSTPTEDAGLPQNRQTTQRPYASEPPPGLYQRHWKSLLNNAGSDETNRHLHGAAETTSTPLAPTVSVTDKASSSSSLLLPRAAAYTPPARHTYPPGAGPLFSSHI